MSASDAQATSASFLKSDDSSAVLRPYREYLIEQCRFVPLRGIRREERHERGNAQRAARDQDERLELERIFVEQDTSVTWSSR